MRPHLDHLGNGRYMTDDARPLLSRDLRHGRSSVANSPRRLRSEDSWIEISSQPSSSSVSSAGDVAAMADLNVQSDTSSLRRRRRRGQLHQLSVRGTQSVGRLRSTTSSSQEEYEESESESDHIMNSSNEDMRVREEAPSLPARPAVEDDDDDDASTALGTGTSETVFTPQPHAFSHLSQTSPPSRDTQTDSYFHPESRLPSNRTITQRDIRRPSINRSRTQTQHTPYNVIAPSHSYQTDHDAALRASLSTLLSCAAAARGLPKRSQSSRALNQQSQGHMIEPTSLRLIPESRLMGGGYPAPAQAPILPARRSRAATSVSSTSPTTATSPPVSSSGVAVHSTKRKVRETSKDRLPRAVKKSRSSARSSPIEEPVVSPTLMTWMISAGFVVLFSAASFAAGYAWGREVGRMESGIAPASDGMQCGREILGKGTSLKRLRWGSSSVKAGT